MAEASTDLVDCFQNFDSQNANFFSLFAFVEVSGFFHPQWTVIVFQSCGLQLLLGCMYFSYDIITKCSDGFNLSVMFAQ